MGECEDKRELVSVITPSYNTEKYISETIQSVQKQTYENWELLIVDDCSTDNTDEVVAAFLDDRRIRYIKNEKNLGAGVARNKALREARGRWIAFLDSDDLWKPDKLEQQIRFMQKGGYAFSYTKYSEIDEKGCTNGKVVSGPRKITKFGMYLYCWPGCLTVMYDASKIGIIQIKDIRKNNDYAMWLKVALKADCYLLDRDLAFYRRRAGSISRYSYFELVKWHYRLYADCMKVGRGKAILYTYVNVVFGCWKKIFYVKHERIL